jgi:hypothetical protein
MTDPTSSYRTIPLTQGKVAIVDAEDYESLSAHRWLVTSLKYAVRRFGGRPVYMHRIILNAPKGIQVDHINGDGLDNRRENLRLATNAQNGRNRKAQKNNTSGFKGVTYSHQEKHWRAQIMANGRNIYLGYFTCPVKAHAAYCEDAQTPWRIRK